MSVPVHLLCRLSLSLLLALSLAVAMGGCKKGEEDDEAQITPLMQRDRASELSAPKMAGPAPVDFDPEDKPRIVELEHWTVHLQTSGIPGALPTEIVAWIDRPVVRRGSPSIGEASRFRVTDADGEEVALKAVQASDNFSIFRVAFEDNLLPGQSYEVAFEAIEFDFGTDEKGREDSELHEFEDPPTFRFEAPRLQLIGISSLRPVDRLGYVEMTFSAPVTLSQLQQHLEWSLNGAALTDLHYDIEESQRVVNVRMQTTASSFADVQGVEISGGNALGGFRREIEVGNDSQGLEIRMVGTYMRAGIPTVRVICHDPSFGDELRYYYDREIYRSVYDLSRRCNVDAERVLEQIDLDVEGELSFVDHPHGFDILLNPSRPGGPLGFALRPGDYGEDLPMLFEGFETVIETRRPLPQLAIEADGRYLQREDWSRIPIRHSDIEVARVVVRHAADHHFLYWLAGSSTVEDMTGRSSFAIAEQYIELDPGPDEVRYSFLNLEDLVGAPQAGAYQIEISAPYHGGLFDSHRFIVSDMQLIAKRARHDHEEVDEIWAWTIDRSTVNPISGIDLQLLRQNGRVLAECTTDEEGFCKLSGNWGDLENEPPFAVVAEGTDQLAYVNWTDTKTEVVEGEIGGLSYHEQPIYRASIRGERTLYRPGETMHFAGFVRGADFGAVADLPVTVEITDSRNQRAFGDVIETDQVGALEFFYDLPEMAATGAWKVMLMTGDETLLTQWVSVEEFMPERIEVTLDLEQNYVFDASGADDRAVTGVVQADYFFGVPASNTDFEVECLFEPANPFAAQWPEYHFGPFADSVDSVTARTSGRLDEEGRGEFHCLPDDFDARAYYSVNIDVAVFEAGSGSSSKASEKTYLLPSNQLVGLRSPDERADVDQGARVEGIVVGPDGQPITNASTVALELGTVTYTWTHMYRRGGYVYERERHESIDDTRTIEVDEQGRFAFQAAPRGRSTGIFIRAEHLGGRSELSINPPYYSWWWGRRNLDPRPDDPTHLAISGPEEIVVGESAQFTFEAPVSGRALVAVETSGVDSWEWIDVTPGENSWAVEIEYFDPNVYVSALYIPNSEEAPAHLDRAFGVQRVKVSRVRFRAEIELKVPQEREPYETLEVEVISASAGPNAKAVVAVVDRGILSMQTVEFDDVLDQLFTIRALGVDTFDTVGWYADVSPHRFGGGSMAPPPMAPPAIMPVRPTAMWSGLVELTEGRATVEFDIPDFRGELEILAVVADGQHLGEARAQTIVVDPLALQASAPRFASHGDRIEVPLSVTNTTDRLIDISIEAEVVPSMMLIDDEAALQLTGPSTRRVSLEPGERGDVVFPIVVTGRAGAPRLIFRAEGDGESSQHYATVPVYPAGPRTVEQAHHSVEGTGFDVLPHLDGWLETSETTELWVTSIPRAPAFRHLDHVLRYRWPAWGYSLLNTTARLRPVIYLDDLFQAATPGESTRSFRWRTQWGIRSMERLQNRDGQFRYWISSFNTNAGLGVDVWGQSYAMDMLTSAEDAGFEVPSWTMRSGLDWLDRRVQRRSDLKDLDLALWVLARNGRPNRRVARALLEELPSLPSGRDHERALLAMASLYLAGDETVEEDLRELIANPRLDPSTRRFSGDFYSAARHEGLVLEVAIELFGTDSDLLEALVERVADRLVDSEVRELNIHELGWSIGPLGRWAKDRAKELPEARLIAAGQEIAPAIVGDDGSRSWLLHRASEYPSVRIEFEDTPTTPVSIFRRTEGVHENSQAQFGRSHLRLDRDFLDAQGNYADLANVEVGDLIYVVLSVSHDENRTISDLALTDRIPGGFEIEDPHPQGPLRPDWFDDHRQWTVDHYDVRDDRMEIYGTIPRDYRNQKGQELQFIYSIRATTAGNFTAPPSEIVSLYQHDRWARIPGGTVTIRRR